MAWVQWHVHPTVYYSILCLVFVYFLSAVGVYGGVDKLAGCWETLDSGWLVGWLTPAGLDFRLVGSLLRRKNYAVSHSSSRTVSQSNPNRDREFEILIHKDSRI